MSIELSVIIPFARKNESRIPALKNVLNSIKHQDLRVHNTNIKNWEFIFVEQVEQTAQDFNCTEFTSGIADKHICIPYSGEFNKSWMMNIGAKEAKGDWLVFVDADMLFGKEYLYFAHLWKSHTPVKFFVGWDTIMKLPGKCEPVPRLIRNTVLTAGGVFWCRKDFYFEIGGMNENYFGYGGEDNDFWVRVNYLIGKNKNLNNVSHCPYPMSHTYHDDAVPSPNRIYILDRTIQHTQEIINRLKQKELGNRNNPTTIDIADLALKDKSLADKKGMGII